MLAPIEWSAGQPETCWHHVGAFARDVSLVVAFRHDDGRFTLVADSKLTFRTRRANPYLEGALKLIVLRDTVCVGVTGVYDPDCIRALVAKREESVAVLLDELARWQVNDFLLASLDEGADLFSIRGGIVEPSSSQRAWAGDPDGYSRFQEAFHARGADRMDARLRMLSSLQWVLGMRPVESIGGFHVRVESGAPGFRYVADASFVGPEVMSGVIEESVDGTTVRLSPVGPVTTFSMQCCPGRPPTPSACGYYIREASVGVLWTHANPEEPIRIKAANAAAFGALALDDHDQVLLV